jgi:fructosamine-3-kinase
MLPQDLDNWLSAAAFYPLHDTVVDGGSICRNVVCENTTGDRLFVKYLDEAPANFFQCEAEGLSYLQSASNVKTPKVHACGANFLALSYIPPKHHSADYWETLGRQLALIHSLTRDLHGFANDNYCGNRVQLNRQHKDGYEFFISNRLLPLAESALDRRLIDVSDLQAIESLCLRLDALVPEQPASLLHGDLWSGNVHVSEKGQPVFIDPAVYFSWAEIDLAMTRLFGGFDQRFYDAYEEVRPLERGWRQRIHLYNLYPVLNHLLMFGAGYLGQVRGILSRYS